MAGLLLFLVHCSPVVAAGDDSARVTLSWEPNPERNLGGYRLYYGPVGTSQVLTINVGNSTQSVVPDLIPGFPYWFLVTAYNLAGLESGPSNLVVKTVPDGESPEDPVIQVVAEIRGNGIKRRVLSEFESELEIPPLADIVLRAAVNANEPVSFQWFQNGEPIPESDSSILALESITPGHGGEYTVEAWRNGEALGEFRFQLQTSGVPTIVVPPRPTAVIEGMDVILSVTAAGAEPLQYQWYHGRAPIESATERSLLLASIEDLDGGEYWVEISNASGRVRSDFVTVTVLPRREEPNDFDGDGLPDLVFQYRGGLISLWSMDGAKLLRSSILPPYSHDPGWGVACRGNLDGAEGPDLLFQHTDGALVIWHFAGGQPIKSSRLPAPPDPLWRAVAGGDFDSDGIDDILFQHSNGDLLIWYMRRLRPFMVDEPIGPGSQWRVAGVGDFDGDGALEIVFRDREHYGRLMIWFFKAVDPTAQVTKIFQATSDAEWLLAAVTDLDLDGNPDFVFQDNLSGALAAWFMEGTRVRQYEFFSPTTAVLGWELRAP